MTDDASMPIPDSPQHGHVVYTVISLLSMAFISTLFGEYFAVGLFVLKHKLTAPGFRVKSFGLHGQSNDTTRSMTPIRCIVAGIYLTGMALMFCLSLMLSGVGLGDLQQCRLGIYLCFLFYVCGNKVLIQLFLVRSPFQENHDNLPDHWSWADAEEFEPEII